MDAGHAVTHAHLSPRGAARRTLAVIAVIIVAMITVLAVGTPTARAGIILDHGHTDIFNVTADKKGLNLAVKEDITGHNVIRDPEEVTLVVKNSAYRSLDGDFAQFGDPDSADNKAFVLPLTQQSDLLWPGWDTQQVASAGLSAVDINFDSVDGPGDVYLFTQGGGLSGGLAPLLSDGSFQLRSGSVRHQDPPAHTHAYWVFTKPGRYIMTVTASAKDLVSNEATYTWIVGDGQAAPTTSAAEAEEKGAVDTTTAVTKPADSVAGAPLAESTEPSPTLAELYDTGPGNSGSLAGISADGSYAATPAGGEAKKPTVAVTAAPHAANFATQASPAEASAQTGTPAGAAAGDSGAAVGAAATAGNAPSGAAAATNTPSRTCHQVDIGPVNMRLVPAIRDDRVSPAALVKPEAYVFHVGDHAAATPNQRIGDLAAGQKVWMISAVQVRDVPWLGANTMEPEFLRATTGELTITPLSMTGPGDLEVFTSGNFGTVVGQRWFAFHNGVPQSQVTIPRNTHVHPNWVFTKPGRYTVRLRFSTHGTDGTALSKDTQLVFMVGGPASPGDVTRGHFDMGATVERDGVSRAWVDESGSPCTNPSTGSAVSSGLAAGSAVADAAQATQPGPGKISGVPGDGGDLAGALSDSAAVEGVADTAPVVDENNDDAQPSDSGNDTGGSASTHEMARRAAAVTVADGYPLSVVIPIAVICLAAGVTGGALIVCRKKTR